MADNQNNNRLPQLKSTEKRQYLVKLRENYEHDSEKHKVAM